MSLFPQGLHPLEDKLNQRIFEIATAQGIKLYLVGGYLRDVLSLPPAGKLPPKDLDYAVLGGSAISFAQFLADKVSGHFVLLDENSDTARVVIDQKLSLDFARCLGNTISEDINRRDFTINALAWSPNEPNQIIDLVNGQNDLKNRAIRAIHEDNIKSDPLRMLRAFRFAATINGTITPETLSMIARHCPKIIQVASERISYELFLVLASTPCHSFIEQMADCGLLEQIFPELAKTRQVTANAFHHLGLFDHSLQAVNEAELALAHLPDWLTCELEKEIAASVSRLAVTKLSALLHDIGKPDTWVITKEGRHTFYGHDQLGAHMCESIAKRLKWSKPITKLSVKLIRWHLRPGQLFHQGTPTDRAIHRFYRTIGQDTPALMLLAFADLGATRGPGLLGTNRQALNENLHRLLNDYPLFLKSQEATTLWLDGHQVMKLLGIKPGPILGEIMSALAEAQGLNEVTNRKEAESFVSEYFQTRYCQ